MQGLIGLGWYLHACCCVLALQLAPKGPYVYVEDFKLCLEPASLGAKRKPLPAGLLVVPVVADFLRCMRK